MYNVCSSYAQIYISLARNCYC